MLTDGQCEELGKRCATQAEAICRGASEADLQCGMINFETFDDIFCELVSRELD